MDKIFFILADEHRNTNMFFHISALDDFNKVSNNKNIDQKKYRYWFVLL